MAGYAPQVNQTQMQTSMRSLGEEVSRTEKRTSGCNREYEEVCESQIAGAGCRGSWGRTAKGREAQALAAFCGGAVSVQVWGARPDGHGLGA